VNTEKEFLDYLTTLCDRALNTHLITEHSPGKFSRIYQTSSYEIAQTLGNIYKDVIEQCAREHSRNLTQTYLILTGLVCTTICEAYIGNHPCPYKTLEPFWKQRPIKQIESVGV
jgi:hypothetical protein